MDTHTLFLHAVRHHQAGDIPKAVTMYRAVLDDDPGNGNCALYLGLALQQLGEMAKARTSFQDAVRLLPGDPDALNGLGAVCFELGRIEEAETAHLTALEAAPKSAEALSGLGNVLLAQGRMDEAIDSFRNALLITPDSPDILSNLGVSLKNANRPQEAVEYFEHALQLAPDSPDILCNLGNVWQVRGNMERARECFVRAQKIAPQAVAPRWGGCFAHLEMSYDTNREMEEARKQYANALDELDNSLTLDTPEQVREAASAVGANQPFYLTYQGKNDRELQMRYGTLVNRIMTKAYPQFTSSPLGKNRTGEIRVGIVTGFMHEHSVWKIPTRGWAHHLDRKRFTVHGYYTGVKDDHCTVEAREAFDTITHSPHDFEALCHAIISDELDVLIYPDIGMDPICAKLAGLRLAPVQCVSLGHPMTTGLPTMDYFLSSDLMEPEDGDQAYTEKLIRLPNLSVHYEPLRHGKPKFDRRHFGLPDKALLYFCPQSLYKYLPDHDQLYPLIARQVPESRFVFLQNATADTLNDRFVERISKAFAAHGLTADKYVTMLPYQGPDEYHALNGLCDLFLDSIEWSGFNTVMEAANAGLPVITWPREHMRGRHAYAVVKMMGHDEAVATSFEDYVALAIRMGNDEEFRLKLRNRTLRNRSRLFGDMETIRGLEDFFKSVAR